MTGLVLFSAVLAFGLGDITDIVENDDVQDALDVADAFYQAGRGVSDSEEYYIGRAVAANVLATYDPAGSSDFTKYLNSVGTWVGRCSPIPCTFGGWHFQLLASEEINAMACPGGTIFVTRGLMRQVRDEDELACVLAHEVAHVVLHHGIKSVQQSRWVQAFSLAGMTTADRLGSEDLQEAAQNYGDVVTDVTESLVTKGYSRESEYSADSLAVIIAAGAGYDPAALSRVLDRMSGVVQRSGPGFWQTHPSPEDRLDDLSSVAGGETAGYQSRLSRFTAAMAGMDAAASPASTGTTGGRGGSGSSDSGSGRGGSTGGSGSGR
jgi:predicted Zn-dependent protease